MGTRTSFRPRQLDINKPLPIVRDLSELDADGANGDKPQDVSASLRSGNVIGVQGQGMA